MTCIVWCSYVCQFFKCGQWVQIAIDDQLPVVPKGYTVSKQKSGQPIFAHGNDDSELWVSIESSPRDTANKRGREEDRE